MPRSVFAHVVERHRRALLWWCVGLATFVVIELVAYPAVRDAAGLQEVWSQLPDAMKAVFGMDAYTDFTRGGGFLDAELFGFTLPLCFLVLAIMTGSRAIAGEEDDGTLELQLAHPISRTRFLLESLAASTVLVVAPAAAVLATLLVGGPIAGIDVPIVDLVAACTRLAVFAALFAALATAMGAALGRHGLTASICGVTGLVVFLASTLGRLVDGVEPIGKLSPFRWVLGSHPASDGFSLGLVAAVALAAVIVAGGAVEFNRRDLR